MDDVVVRLEGIVGPAHVLTGAETEAFLVDVRGRRSGGVVAVVRPADSAEVAAVVALCRDDDLVIVTQGGNTGMSGGAMPVGDRPTVLLRLDRLTEIEEIDPVGNTATVGAGVTIEALRDAAAEAGRMFAPDWGARGTATVGGAISTDAGGINALRFGTMRDQVLGVEAVLADGRVWNGLRRLRKDSSGIDLAQLFVGAEGTLGILTRAVVRLVPARNHERTALAALTSLDRAEDVVRAAHGMGDDVTALELMPDSGVARVLAKIDRRPPLSTTADWYVLVRLSASTPVDDRLTALLADLSASGTVSDAVVAATDEQERLLWTIRDELSPALLFPSGSPEADTVKLDSAVPVDRVVDFIEGCRRLATDLVPGSEPLLFGHLGDGNIHIHILPPDASAPGWTDRKPALRTALEALTLRLGGTLSAEHGVGRDLVEGIRSQKSAVELELVAVIRDVFDPDRRLNPDTGIDRP